MIWILDTNVISAVRRPDRAPQVAAWLAGKAESALFLSVVTLGEIERGIRRQEARNPGFATDLRGWLDRTQTLFADRILPFDAADARIWGQLSADLGHAGADLMIAAGMGFPEGCDLLFVHADAVLKDSGRSGAGRVRS